MKKGTVFILLCIGIGIMVIVAFTQYRAGSNSSRQSIIPQQPSLPVQESQAVTYHAAFAIYTNGTKRIFTDPKYHNQSADVFITEDTPGIISLRKSGVTWEQFFQTLPMKLTDQCLTTGTGQVFCDRQNGTLKFFLNGVLTFDVLTRTIQNKDQLLVTFGSETQKQINQQMQEIATP